MKNLLVTTGFVACFLAGCSTASIDDTKNNISPEPQRQTASLESVMRYLNDNTRLIPTKIFDNLYCIGSVSVVCYALKTSDGIILIDSMWDDEDAKFIEKSLLDLKMDPKDLKYIFITHGHGDHYGGAAYLAKKYHAKVLMSEVDRDFMHKFNEGPNGLRSPKAPVDILIKDQDKLTLGDTTVTLLSTPGHTPGCMSALFEVKKDGNSYNAVLWGGTSIPNDRYYQEQYLNSALYFKQVANSNDARVVLTAHLFADNGFSMLNAVNRGTGNPFLRSTEDLNEYLDNIILSAQLKLEQTKQQ